MRLFVGCAGGYKHPEKSKKQELRLTQIQHDSIENCAFFVQLVHCAILAQSENLQVYVLF